MKIIKCDINAYIAIYCKNEFTAVKIKNISTIDPRYLDFDYLE